MVRAFIRHLDLSHCYYALDDVQTGTNISIESKLNENYIKENKTAANQKKMLCIRISSIHWFVFEKWYSLFFFINSFSTINSVRMTVLIQNFWIKRCAQSAYGYIDEKISAMHWNWKLIWYHCECGRERVFIDCITWM